METLTLVLLLQVVEDQIQYSQLSHLLEVVEEEVVAQEMYQVICLEDQAEVEMVTIT